MNDNDNSNFVPVLGGLLVVIVLGALAIKALKELFHQLAITFDAWSAMMGSFFTMTWEIFKITVLIAGMGGVIVGAIWCTWKYVQLVRRATDIVARACDRMNEIVREFTEHTLEPMDERLSDVEWKLKLAEQKIEQLLKPPTPMPEPVSGTTVAPSEPSTGPTVIIQGPATTNTILPQASLPHTTQAAETELVQVSHLY